jgi:hypothetical protein
MSLGPSRMHMKSSTLSFREHNMKKILATIFILAIFVTPTVTFAVNTADSPDADYLNEQDGAPKLDYSGFVKCDGVVKPSESGRQVTCTFGALIDTIIKAINWMFVISVPLAVALFAYAGLLYMTGQEGKIKEAKAIFSSVAIGFIIMLTAWFAVRQVVSWFVKDATATTFLGK